MNSKIPFCSWCSKEKETVHFQNKGQLAIVAYTDHSDAGAAGGKLCRCYSHQLAIKMDPCCFVDDAVGVSFTTSKNNAV